MSFFQFKEFSVYQVNSAMKVGTDAMILGALIKSVGKTNALDIGSGTGVLSMMVAQVNSHINIKALEIDALSATESQRNFKESPWKDRLTGIHVDFLNFEDNSKFDLIFSNPPYHQSTLLNKDVRQGKARHVYSLPIVEFLKKVCSLLTDSGSFWIIIPFQDVDDWINRCADIGLHENARVNIIGKREEKNKRIVLEFQKTKTTIKYSSSLTIREQDGSYTKEYIELTKEFHGKQL